MSLFTRSILLLVSALALTLAGCSGSGSSTGDVQIRCVSGGSFCLVSCDLGCGATSCAVTEVAENQQLQFVFNQAIDRNSVHPGSFALRTVSGESPQGETVVDGNRITFVPSISVRSGVSTFGFRRNESYVVTLLGGTQGGIKSSSGLVLPKTFTCTVTATRGIVDEDNAPPRATLVTPATLVDAPTNVTIVVRFSEVVDTTPFLQPVSASSPIQYVLRETIQPAGGDRECDIDSAALPLEGLPRIGLEQVNGRPVTTISLKPTLNLPGLTCVEVRVTGDVRDLAGRSAEEATFRFQIEPTPVTDTLLTESFADEGQMDTDVSGGTWSNGARPALVGGDGRHGSFVAEDGVASGANTFVWDTDNFTIPATRTFSEQAETVTDGKFFFSDFVVPAGVTVRFQGDNPARIYVRGKVDIRGVVQLSGADQVTFDATNPVPAVRTTPTPGQVGSAGGPGGGRGGRGADRCFGQGAAPNNDGSNGEDVVLQAGHAYAAQAVGTGGRGAPIFPSHGQDTSLTPTYTVNNLYSGALGSGGGGGGFAAVGGEGNNPSTTPPFTVPTAFAAGGSAFDPVPKPAGFSSLDHFMIGGSGGGGGGSSPYAALAVDANPFQFDRWRAGGGGSGGGGTMAIRSGRSIEVSGSILSKGGAGANYNGDNPATPGPDTVNTANANWGVAAPGGGGSGGSVLLQADRSLAVTNTASLDTSGGIGGRNTGVASTTAAPLLANVSNFAGDGAAGFYRLEVGPTGTLSMQGSGIPAYVAARNSGTLTDRDDVSGARSLWRPTQSVLPPRWVRYELDVDTDGDGTVDVTYTDDPTVPVPGPANDPLGPVTIKFQGAQVSSTGIPAAGSIGPWRDFVTREAGSAIGGDNASGFRFQLLFNTAAFPDAVVRRLTVVVQIR
ncbi:MAG: hypothetical protein AB7O97_09375 [Planctomycetota bacterium]